MVKIKPTRRIKPILPSLKEKKRYLVFEIVSENKINDSRAISDVVWDSTLDFIGSEGAARAGVWVLEDKFNASKQKGIIKVSNKYVDKLRTSLALVNSINKQPVVVKTLGVSGILNKAEKKYIAS